MPALRNLFDLDHWQEIGDALRRNRLRTALTAFGVFWGIFMLIVMLGSGNGLKNGVSQDFEGAATNSFFIWSQRTSKPYRGLPSGREPGISDDDVAAIRQSVPEVGVIAPRTQMGGYGSTGTVNRGRRSGGFSVMGDVPAITAIQSMPIVRGRFLNDLDLAEGRKVAVIGTRVQEVLFAPGEDPLGQLVRANGVYFTVIGVYRSTATGDEAERQAQMLFVPLTTYQRAFNSPGQVGWLSVTSDPGIPASVTEEKVLALLRSRHQVAPDDARAFGHWNQEEEYQKLAGLFSGIRMLIWVVGVGTLAAGAIGVSNIMLVIVKERTREIGIRRAVGAAPLSILGQVMLEAVALTAVAGYLGLLAGIGLLELLGSTMAKQTGTSMFVSPEVSLASVLQALAVLIVAGALAGLVPALRAVRIRPVEALRA